MNYLIKMKTFYIPAELIKFPQIIEVWKMRKKIPKSREMTASESLSPLSAAYRIPACCAISGIYFHHVNCIPIADNNVYLSEICRLS